MIRRTSRIAFAAAIAIVAPLGLITAAPAYAGPPARPAAARASTTAASPHPFTGTLLVTGPTDHYVERGVPSAVPLPQQYIVQPSSASLVPFSFTFDVSYGIDGRNWTTSSGRACYNAAVTLTSGSPLISYIYVQLFHSIANAADKQVGPTVDWPTNGHALQYCFTGLSSGSVYYFFQGFLANGNGAYVHGAGSITPS